MSVLNTSRLEILTPVIGARIDGVIFRSPKTTRISRRSAGCFTHRVVFFEGQNLSPQQHCDFAARFGAFQIHPFYQAHTEYPQLVVLDTGAHSPTDNDHWHTDMTYAPAPPMAGILYSRLIPPAGGDTLWADMHAAYLALSPSLRRLLDPLDAVHDLAKAFPPQHRAVHESGADRYAEKMKANPPVLHPGCGHIRRPARIVCSSMRGLLPPLRGWLRRKRRSAGVPVRACELARTLRALALEAEHARHVGQSLHPALRRE